MAPYSNGRFRSVIFKVGGALAFIGLGIGGGLLLHSPGERITYDLPPSQLTAQVTSQGLSTDLTGSGIFQNTGHISISAQAPADRSLVVTRNPLSVGQEAAWCDVIVEVSGRPILLLQGEIPAYRDLTAGDSGRDVRQLQEALRGCGYQVAADGIFGKQTEKVIKSLYADAGYSPVTDLSAALGPVAAVGAVETPGVENVAFMDAAFVQNPVVRSETVNSPNNGMSILNSLQEDTSAGPQRENDAESAVKETRTDSPPDPPKVYAARGEFRFVRSTPKVLSQLPEGSEPQGEEIIKLSLLGDIFLASLPAEHIAKVHEGQEVLVSFQEWSSTATLPELTQTPNYGGGGTPTLEIPIALKDPAPEGAYEEPGQFTIRTGTDQIYERVVPVSAINQDTSGQQFVWKLKSAERNTTEENQGGGGGPATENSDLERIDITVLESAGGYVAVEIVTGALEVGDSVVIGTK